MLKIIAIAGACAAVAVVVAIAAILVYAATEPDVLRVARAASLKAMAEK